MGKFIKALEVVDLGLLNDLFFNLLDEALQYPHPHPEFFHTEGCHKAGQKIDMDLNVLKPFRGVLGTFPEFIQVFFEVIYFRVP